LKIGNWSRIIAVSFLAFHLQLPSIASGQTQPPTHRPQAQTITIGLEGDWDAKLQAGEAVIHLVLHLAKASDGSVKATIDSLDQGVYGIEVTSYAQKNLTLRFTVSSVSASFEGRISTDHRTIDGVWTQGSASLPLGFHRQAAGAGAKKPVDAISPSEGVWQGALEGNGMRLRLQLHVSHADQNQLVAALDSPDQTISGLPATRVSEKDSAFHFEIPVVNGTYDGTLNSTRNAITGTWTQNDATQPLEFKRSDKLLELIRPQTPVKPFPYREVEVVFPNSQAKISLSGTLTLPPGSGPFLVAILLHGSGPHDRDETLLGHRPFLVLADHLTRKGIAVLRFDKRGNGKSTGDYANATTEDFASDCQSAIAYLKTRKDIDSKRIGLIGHSEGGIIAPMVAARSKDVAWIVLLAGPGLNGEDSLLLQSKAILRTTGVNEGQIATTLNFNKQTYALVRQQTNREALESKLADLVQSSGMSLTLPSSALQLQMSMLVSPWFRYFLDYDPVPALQKTQCPVLALNGEKDLQVPAQENLASIGKALQTGGNKDFQITPLPGLNHLFQHCPTGSPTEYGAIEETIAPEALDAVSDWVLKHTSP
jgi:pimeloyl-ACP methyl ester carboxylesterase